MKLCYLLKVIHLPITIEVVFISVCNFYVTELRYAKSVFSGVDDIIAHFKKYMTSLGQTDIAIFAIISNFVGRPITKFADISVETLIDVIIQ